MQYCLNTNHPTDEIVQVTAEAGARGENTLDTGTNNEDNGANQVLPPEVMTVTPDHPVYVEDKGWVWAENLAVGDRLRQADGGWATVLAVERIKLDKPELVYNFTVKGPHTYFVMEVGVLMDDMTCVTLQASEFTILSIPAIICIRCGKSNSTG